MFYLCPAYFKFNPVVVRAVLFFAFLVSIACHGQSSVSLSAGVQKLTIAPTDADSSYIMRYSRPNDIRFLYGGVGTSLAFGSTREGDNINTALYNNVNDLIGLGLTYKIIDADISFSMPNSKLLEEDRENLEQIRFSLSYTGRQWAVRGFYVDSRGMISADQGGEFTSQPDIQLQKIGAQVTYIFNKKKYSYRAANFQNEMQKKTAGSFLLRFEPSYRYLQAPTGLVPESRDLETTYGNQVGLQSSRAPGAFLKPGYGLNVAFADGKFFISPIVLVGPGFAYNTYIGEKGEFHLWNYEWSATSAINLGYNSARAYASVRIAYDIYYISLNPSYITTTDLKIGLTVGYRFNNLEKLIPTF